MTTYFKFIESLSTIKIIIFLSIIIMTLLSLLHYLSPAQGTPDIKPFIGPSELKDLFMSYNLQNKVQYKQVLYIDFIFPLIYPLLFSLVFFKQSYAEKIVSLPLIIIPLDYLENIFEFMVLQNGVTTNLLQLIAVFNALKWTSIIILFIIFFIKIKKLKF